MAKDKEDKQLPAVIEKKELDLCKLELNKILFLAKELNTTHAIAASILLCVKLNE